MPGVRTQVVGVTAVATSLDIASTVGAELALVLCAFCVAWAVVAAVVWAVLVRIERGRE